MEKKIVLDFVKKRKYLKEQLGGWAHGSVGRALHLQ